MLSAGGKQFEDWSAAYRIFENNRFDRQLLFAPVIEAVSDALSDDSPFYTSIDDTITRKRGKKIAGANWKRDPLGPQWHNNFIWGQRYLQMSAMLPDAKEAGRARGIPIDFIHAPTLKKPPKNAGKEKWDAYHAAEKPDKVTVLGAKRLMELRDQIHGRNIICSVDGGFTNKEVFRNIPANTAIIGRIRKDASLFASPEPEEGIRRGRKKYYGARLPTPEQIRQDESVPWQQVQAYATGKTHEFDVKVITPIRWKGAGDRDVLVMIIRPLAYRPKKDARLSYRNPAYLICTDPSLPLEQLLQAYIWRWEVEVNFRDEKTLMGVGQAGVRTETAVQNLPAFQVATYSYTLLAAELSGSNQSLPTPKWQRKLPPGRLSTSKIQSLFRTEFWLPHLLHNKRGFVQNTSRSLTHLFSIDSPYSAICSASNG